MTEATEKSDDTLLRDASLAFAWGVMSQLQLIPREPWSRLVPIPMLSNPYRSGKPMSR